MSQKVTYQWEYYYKNSPDERLGIVTANNIAEAQHLASLHKKLPLKEFIKLFLVKKIK